MTNRSQWSEKERPNKAIARRFSYEGLTGNKKNIITMPSGSIRDIFILEKNKSISNETEIIAIERNSKIFTEMIAEINLFKKKSRLKNILPYKVDLKNFKTDKPIDFFSIDLNGNFSLELLIWFRETVLSSVGEAADVSVNLSVINRNSHFQHFVNSFFSNEYCREERNNLKLEHGISDSEPEMVISLDYMQMFNRIFSGFKFQFLDFLYYRDSKQGMVSFKMRDLRKDKNSRFWDSEFDTFITFLIGLYQKDNNIQTSNDFSIGKEILQKKKRSNETEHSSVAVKNALAEVCQKLEDSNNLLKGASLLQEEAFSLLKQIMKKKIKPSSL